MTTQKRLSDEQRKDFEQLWNDSSQMNKRQFISCIESIAYPDESKPLQVEVVGGNSESKLTFETLPDGTNVITVKGKNIHGDIFLRQEVIKEKSVFDALYAAQQVSIQTQAKDKEIERLKAENKELNDIINDYNKPYSQ